MPLDRHARRFLEMLAAAGQAKGHYDSVEDRRAALTNLADMVDPPGSVEIGGVRDHLMPVTDGHVTLRTYSPLGEPERILPGMLFFHGGGWVAGSLDTLVCPILDVQGESSARQELAEGYFLDSETLRRDLELYVPDGIDLTDVRLSPLRAEEFANLPPAFIHTAQFDPFSDEGEAYAQRLGGFGVPVHGRTHPGMIHYFYCMPRMIPYAQEAMRIIGTEIRYAVQLPELKERRIQRRIRPELIRA